MKLIIGFLAFLFFSFTLPHKYFHSYTDLQINSATGHAEAVIELFWHDLEVSLSKECSAEMTTKSNDFENQLKKYLSRHFLLTNSSDKPVEFRFVGQQINGEEMEIYLESIDIIQFKGMKLKNTLLVKEFPEQVNQVSIKHNNRKETMVFTAKKTEFQLN